MQLPNRSIWIISPVRSPSSVRRGASGASRAVVLADGIPLNDPFGGWIYWSRVPRTSVNSIEVLRGGASHLYGSAALGGVINIFQRQPQANTPNRNFRILVVARSRNVARSGTSPVYQNNTETVK